MAGEDFAWKLRLNPRPSSQKGSSRKLARAFDGCLDAPRKGAEAKMTRPFTLIRARRRRASLASAPGGSGMPPLQPTKSANGMRSGAIGPNS
jgi:hypothetical protein